MAHGDKRWIVDASGRIKRSTDRTYKDWKAGLHRFQAGPKHCKDCAAKEAPYKAYWKLSNAEYQLFRAKYGEQAWKHVKEMKYPYRHQPLHDRYCDRCKALDDLKWKWHKPKVRAKRWSRTGVPKAFRQELNRDYRTKVRHRLRNGDYDNLPVHKRNAARLYW